MSTARAKRSRACHAHLAHAFLRRDMLAAGTAYLLVRRRKLFRWRTVAELWPFCVGQGMLAESLRAMGRYLTPAFHP